MAGLPLHYESYLTERLTPDPLVYPGQYFDEFTLKINIICIDEYSMPDKDLRIQIVSAYAGGMIHPKSAERIYRLHQGSTYLTCSHL